MTLIMVPDPDFKGPPENAPTMPRAWAMRKLFKQGMTIGDIGRSYGTTYAEAYRAINPPRQPASSPTSTRAKPLTRERLARMTKSEVMKIVYIKERIKVNGKVVPNPQFNKERADAAVAEADRRWPNWFEES